MNHDPLCSWSPANNETELDFCDCDLIARVREDERSKPREARETVIVFDDDNLVDEIVTYDPPMFHLERMTRNTWWIGLPLPDGRRIAITAKNLTVLVED